MVTGDDNGIQDSITPHECCPPLTTVTSGSPILQNNMLVGAVTHVFIKNPIKGYGIFAENMMEVLK